MGKHFSRKTIKVGQNYGRWTIIESSMSRAGFWLCRCGCGFEKEVEGYTLVTNRSTQCMTCANKERMVSRRGSGDLVAARQAWSKHRQNAKERDLITEIDFDLFYKISKMSCHYCGSLPKSGYWENSSYRKEWNKPFISNGLDRFDNSKGYIKDNVIPCCIRCNRAKNDMSIEEWKEKIIAWHDWLQKLP